MRKIVPVLVALMGLGGGLAAGAMLAPEPAKEAALAPCGPDDVHSASISADVDGAGPAPIPVESVETDGEEELGTDNEYVKLNNQFLVPVVKDGRVSSLVVMSLSVEVELGGRESVFQREPKLRDVFLQVLFDHANSGGFDENFTSSLNMAALRSGLLASSYQVLGPIVKDVLIQDIARQDV
jgi:flagellar FliL protein